MVVRMASGVAPIVITPCRANDLAHLKRLYRRLGYAGDFSYVDSYFLVDASGIAHEIAHDCRFLVKQLSADAHAQVAGSS
jgi:hypothetical protein